MVLGQFCVDDFGWRAEYGELSIFGKGIWDGDAAVE